MVRKKCTVVNLTSLQNMFKLVDIKIPPSSADDKQKSGYRNRRYDDRFNSESRGFRDGEDVTSSWRIDDDTREKTDGSFSNIRRVASKGCSPELNDDSWSNLRTLSRESPDKNWRDSSCQRSDSRFGSKKSEHVDTRPQRLKLKLLPKGSKAKSEAENKLDSVNSRSLVTNNKDFVMEQQASIDNGVTELTNKSVKTQSKSIANINDTDDTGAEIDLALKSRMVAIRKQKELEEACKNEILSYNALFNCDPERAKLVLDTTIQIFENGATDYSTMVDHINSVSIENNSNNCFETIVPSVVALCYIVCKMSDVKTLEQSNALMSKIKGWLKYLIGISNIKNHELHLLNQISIICNYWNLPSLSNDLFLIEAVFDSLYCCGIISHSSFNEWFQDNSSEIPSKITIMFQVSN